MTPMTTQLLVLNNIILLQNRNDHVNSPPWIPYIFGKGIPYLYPSFWHCYILGGPGVDPRDTVAFTWLLAVAALPTKMPAGLICVPCSHLHRPHLKLLADSSCAKQIGDRFFPQKIRNMLASQKKRHHCLKEIPIEKNQNFSGSKIRFLIFQSFNQASKLWNELGKPQGKGLGSPLRES